MIVLEDILSQEIIQKLGWTLLHFIWQAAVAASLLAILLRLLRKSTPSLRYILACLALALIVLLPIITIQLVPISAQHPAAHIESSPVPIVLPTIDMPATETIVFEEPVQPESVTPVYSVSWKQRTVATLEPALPYIVSGWLIGVFALSIWHMGGWAQLQRLKRRMVKQVDNTLHSKLKVLAQRLRVKQAVQLMESALVQIPTVIGWLRPVILLPASALTGLSSEQLEAILAHELAHIRRCDYLINILQTVVEILGFYHPAVWWVSHKIRAERENCCDDLAVSISGDPVCYARALTSMEEIRTGQGQLAVAATGGNLFKRIYRLLGKDKTDKTGFSWIPAAAAILLIIALVIPTTLAFTTKSDSQQPDSKIEVHVENDRSGESQQEKEPSVDDILTVRPTIAKSPTPSDQDKTIIQVDCLVVEVFTDLKMDREATIVAENILGDKISLRDTKVDVLLRKAAKATAATKDKSAENKRVTQEQFKAFVDMLTSKGYLRILMNPRIEVVNGKTAKISSTQKISSMQGSIEDSIQITPHVFADGHIILQVEATISSKSKPKGIEQIPIVTTREVSTLVRTSPGESRIIGCTKKTEKSTKPDSNVKETKEQATEVLFILTPTIITHATDSQEKTDTKYKAKSAKKLKRLGLALIMYADDHDNKLPDTLEPLKPYIANEQDYLWIVNNVEYIGKSKTYLPNQPRIPVAYDKTQIDNQSGTNVVFLDGHVEFLTPQRLKELGISATEIQIETRLLLVSEDFLQNIGLDANSVHSSKAWSEHLVADSAAEPNAETYSLLLDDLHISFLLKAVQAHKDAHVLVSPRVLTREAKTAEIGIMTEEYYVLGYTEPNDPSDKPVPKTDKVELGTRLWLKPEITPDNENIKLDFKMEFRQLLGYEERKYKGKYIYLVPRSEVVSTEMPCLIPDGNTLLIGGKKITNKASVAPILSRLPVVGGLFRSRDKTKEQRVLLILVKPIINPQQKASKILPGQADSEEHIKHLANQLEKKLNRPAD